MEPTDSNPVTPPEPNVSPSPPAESASPTSTPAPTPAPETQAPLSPAAPGTVVVSAEGPASASSETASSEPAPTPASGAAPPPASAKKSRFSFHPSKKVLTVVAAVVVLAGAGAAAYQGVIVPNKPANVVKTALFNTSQAPQSSLKGSLDATTNSGDSKAAYKIDFDGSQDSVAKAASLKLDMTISGISFPIEGRIVDKNIYVRVGDLNTIVSLVNAYSPEFGSLAQAVSGKLSNQWIVIDSTLVKQAKMDCFLDASWGLNKADQQIFEQVYGKHQFATVAASGSDVVNGHKVAKYTVTIDNDKAAAYLNDNSFNNLSLAKSLTKCDKSATSANAADNLKGDHKKTVLTLWVDKGAKRVAKVAYNIDSGDTKGTISGTFDYGKVNITAPSGAKPALQVLTDLQSTLSSSPAFGQLFSGASTALPSAANLQTQ